MQIPLDRKPEERAKRESDKHRSTYAELPDQESKLTYMCTTGRSLLVKSGKIYLELSDAYLNEFSQSEPLALHGQLLEYRAVAMVSLGRFADSEKTALQSLAFARQFKNRKLEVRVLHHLADLNLYLCRFDEAIDLVEQSKVIVQEIGYLEGRLRNHWTSSGVYLETGFSARAIQEIDQLLVLARESGRFHNVGHVYHRLGLAHLALRKYDAALRPLTTFLKLARANNNIINITTALNTMVCVHIEQGRIGEETHAWLDEARYHAENISNDYLRMSIELNTAGVYVCEERFEEALPHVLLGAQLANSKDATSGKVEAAIILARISIAQKRDEEALRHMRETLTLAQEANLFKYERETCELLQNFYADKADFKMAYTYAQKVKHLQQQEFERNYSDEALGHKYELELENTHQTVSKLSSENELHQAETMRAEAERDRMRKELVAKTLQMSSNYQLLDESVALLKNVKTGKIASNDKSVTSLISSLTSLSSEATLWQDFEEQFTLLHPDFQDRLFKRYPKLTVTERKVCSLMKLNIPSKDICRILRIGMRSLDSHRYNIRKKLQLPGKIDIRVTLNELD